MTDEIKTLDDLIKHVDFLHDDPCSRRRSGWSADNIYEAILELKANIEAKQSKDRELLESLTLPHLTEEELIMASTHSPFHGSFELALQVRRHLKENP